MRNRARTFYKWTREIEWKRLQGWYPAMVGVLPLTLSALLLVGCVDQSSEVKLAGMDLTCVAEQDYEFIETNTWQDVLDAVGNCTSFNKSMIFRKFDFSNIPADRALLKLKSINSLYFIETNMDDTNLNKIGRAHV